MGGLLAQSVASTLALLKTSPRGAFELALPRAKALRKYGDPKTVGGEEVRALKPLVPLDEEFFIQCGAASARGQYIVVVDASPALQAMLSPGDLTRSGWEMQHIATRHRAVTEPILARAGVQCRRAMAKPLYVHANLGNGCKFHDRLDEQLPDVRLWVRVAAAGLLHVSVDAVLAEHYGALGTVRVLEEMVRRHRRANGMGENEMVAAIVHVDEFNSYAAEVQRTLRVDPRGFFKQMLLALGNAMLQASASSYFVIPVVTGTSISDVTLSATDYGRWALTPPRLRIDDAREMFLDMHLLGRQKPSSEAARTAAEAARHVPPGDLSLGVDWGGELIKSVAGWVKELDSFGGREAARATVALALLNMRVDRGDELPHATGDVRTVADLERLGIVTLQDDDRIHIPFVVLFVLNQKLGPEIFNHEFLRIPSFERPWAWNDWEDLHGDFHRVLTGMMAEWAVWQKPEGWALSEVFRGAKFGSVELSEVRVGALFYTLKRKIAGELGIDQKEVLSDANARALESHLQARGYRTTRENLVALRDSSTKVRHDRISHDANKQEVRAALEALNLTLQEEQLWTNAFYDVWGEEATLEPRDERYRLVVGKK
eukprot:m51a1_g979 hypothetical protein (602) ;mRNA; r:410219-418443